MVVRKDEVKFKRPGLAEAQKHGGIPVIACMGKPIAQISGEEEPEEDYLMEEEEATTGV